MGLFSKVFKKIKKGFKSVFKSIGKGIKSAFKKIGKFMGKIGIIGQLALMFTPIGAVMGNVLGSIGGAVGKAIGTGIGKMTASSNVLVKGAGKILEAGAKFAKAGHSAFRTVTDGVSTFVKEFTGAALEKVGIKTGIESKTFGQAWKATQEAVSTRAGEVMAAFETNIAGTSSVTPTGDVQAGGEKIDIKTDVKADVKADLKKVPEITSDKSLLADPKMDASGFNQKAFDDALKIDPQKIDASGFNQTAFNKDLATGASKTATQLVTTPEPTLMDKLVTGIKEAPKKFVEGVVKEVQEAPTTLAENLGDRATAGIETKAMQAVGLEEKPVAPIQYNAYVPSFDLMPAGSYASPDINDRAMQVQLSGGGYYDQAPFGAGANFYLQTMSRGVGGTV